MRDRTYYVYEHWRPDKDEPFYVGRGKARRAYNMNWRNPHHRAVQVKLARLGMCAEVRLVAEGMTQYVANLVEIERIAFWKERGVRLTNKTAGGEGTPELPAWNRMQITCLSDGLIFDSLKDAAKYYGISISCLSQICQGERGRATAKGRHFILGAHALSEADRIEKIREMIVLQVSLRKIVPEPKQAYGSIISGRDALNRRATGPMRNARSVKCLTDGQSFPSASEAARHYGVPRSAIIELCLGKNGRRTVGGHVFEYEIKR